MQPGINTTVLGFSEVGYATDLAPQAREFNFLTRAENAIFELSGAARKVGGTARVNATALTGTPSVLGLFDFWFSGTGGTSNQLLVAFTSDSKVYSVDSSGVATDRTGAASITANSIPVFCQMRDLLTIWTSAADTPLKYNQTGNVASLAGSPPAGRGAVFHLNRPWVWGTNANPSRITYGSSISVEDYTGTDTGSLDIDPEDGDRIIGVVSHKKRLVIFKGPYNGSVHVIEGSAPTGADGFSRRLLFRGLPLQTFNSIIKKGDDVWFMAQDGCYSLLATEQTGDFTQGSLTPLLKKYFREDLNKTRLNQVWGVNYSEKDCVLWCVPKSGNSTNNEIFGLSYANNRLRAFYWTRSAQCLAIRIHPTTQLRELISGGASDGFIDRQDQSTRRLANGTAYALRATTPSLVLAAQDKVGLVRADQPFYLEAIYLRSRPVGDYNIQIDVQRDNDPLDSYTFNQTTSGFLLDTDFLDSAALLGGPLLQVIKNDAAGEARSVSLDIQQGGLDQDAEIYEVAIDWKPSAASGATGLP